MLQLPVVENDLNKEVVEYHIQVHVFGNSPSRAVLISGLRKALQREKVLFDDEVEFFAYWIFATEAGAIDVLHHTKMILAASNITVHKLASNCTGAMEAFSAVESANDIKDLSLFVDALPVHRSLGVSWDTMSDTFTFHVPESQKPFTHSGVLSIVNSLFDPLGFLAPVTIEGRPLFREISTQDTE